MGRITLGKRTPSRGKRYGATSRIRRYHVEITHMDWPRAVLHTGVSEVDPARLGWVATQQRAEVLPGKTRAHQGGEPYRGRIHMWDHQRGITTHGHLAQHRGWPWATYEYWTWRLVLRHTWLPRVREELQQGSPWGTELRSKRRTYPVRRGEWRSKRDWHRAGSSVTGHPRQVHGRTLALYGDCKTSQTY